MLFPNLLLLLLKLFLHSSYIVQKLLNFQTFLLELHYCLFELSFKECDSVLILSEVIFSIFEFPQTTYQLLSLSELPRCLCFFESFFKFPNFLFKKYLVIRQLLFFLIELPFQFISFFLFLAYDKIPGMSFRIKCVLGFLKLMLKLGSLLFTDLDKSLLQIDYLCFVLLLFFEELILYFLCVLSIESFLIFELFFKGDFIVE